LKLIDKEYDDFCIVIEQMIKKHRLSPFLFVFEVILLNFFAA